MSKSLHSAPQLLLMRRLKEARLARDVTQVELARRLNKPQSFVTKYETGERRLDVVEFVRIAKALDFDPMVIMRELADLEVSVARL